MCVISASVELLMLMLALVLIAKHRRLLHPRYHENSTYDHGSDHRTSAPSHPASMAQQQDKLARRGRIIGMKRGGMSVAAIADMSVWGVASMTSQAREMSGWKGWGSDGEGRDRRRLSP